MYRQGVQGCRRAALRDRQRLLYAPLKSTPLPNFRRMFRDACIVPKAVTEVGTLSLDFQVHEPQSMVRRLELTGTEPHNDSHTYKRERSFPKNLHLRKAGGEKNIDR